MGAERRLGRGLMRASWSVLWFLLLGFSLAAPRLMAVEFEAREYQEADGALLLNPGGDAIEPYMATKALLAAQDAGLDIRRAAFPWIRWLLARQRPDGRFNQYCRAGKNQWRTCGPADADDSMEALWLQLLYRLAPNTGIPTEWLDSVGKSQAQLFALHSRRWGVYRIARDKHAGLLMDNVEVYAALTDMARAERRFGNGAAARQLDSKARNLANAIEHIFWDKRARRFFFSTQRVRHGGFYPDAVAQTYAWSNDMPTPEGDVSAAWRRWLTDYAGDWLSRRSVPDPWGLLALTALHLGDDDTAACWLAQAAPARGGRHWNIIEEAAFQAVAAHVGEGHCTGALALR
jgi:hypothetical protein